MYSVVHTDEQEKLVSAGTSWIDCFRGSDLKRTEIAAVSFGAQALCGSAIMGVSSGFVICQHRAERQDRSNFPDFSTALSSLKVSLVCVVS